MIDYNRRLIDLSRYKRNNMTPEENHLWARIRKRQLKDCQFYRQRIIGDYIVDFYCAKAKLIIEVDGGQHTFEDRAEKDSKRDSYLRNRKLRVVRFTNNEVRKNIDGVVEKILESI